MVGEGEGEGEGEEEEEEGEEEEGEEEEEERTENGGRGVEAGIGNVGKSKRRKAAFESGCKVHWGLDHRGQGSRESRKGGGSASLHICSSLEISMRDFLFVLDAGLALIFSLCCWRGVSEWNDETDPLSNVGKGDSQSAGSTKGKGFS
jgi:hypothetical protein